jgi:hypothetical protein
MFHFAHYHGNFRLRRLKQHAHEQHAVTALRSSKTDDEFIEIFAVRNELECG